MAVDLAHPTRGLWTLPYPHRPRPLRRRHHHHHDLDDAVFEAGASLLYVSVAWMAWLVAVEVMLMANLLVWMMQAVVLFYLGLFHGLRWAVITGVPLIAGGIAALADANRRRRASADPAGAPGSR